MKMKNIIYYIEFILSAALLFGAPLSAHAQKDRYLIEGEAFQFKGKWSVESNSDCMGGKMLRLNGGGSDSEEYDALTAIHIWEEGEYTVWVRAADFGKQQGTRLFRLSINGTPMKEAGRHGYEGFRWENVGQIYLERGLTLLSLHDTRKNFGRCDAILLIKDAGLDPNSTDRKETGKWRRNPAVIETEAPGDMMISPSADVPSGIPAEVTAENDLIRVSFVRSADGYSFFCRTEINVNGSWRRFLDNSEDHKVFLITSSGSHVDNDRFFPAWENGPSKRTFVFGKKEYSARTDGDIMNPFYSGNLSEAIPVKVRQVSERCIETEYLTRNGSSMTGLWKIPEKGCHIELELTCIPATDGMYSMGVAAFQPIGTENAGNILMPPMFQYRRYPEEPVMLMSSMMQQPLAATEAISVTGDTMTSFVSGDDTTFPLEWGSVDYSPIGFSIKNWDNMIQPVAFAPVMGMADSKAIAGQPMTRKFIIGALNDGWTQALGYISDNLYKVSDYRKQTGTSLTDCIFSMIDLMSDEEFGGWDKSLKGFYDIEGNPETAPTVVHAAPLAILSAAAITDDEDFYISRALPTIEYTLSRSGYRWAEDIVPSGYNKNSESLVLNPFRSQFTTSCYEGINRLTQGLNPWISDIALPDGKLRNASGYSTRPQSWVQALSAYRMTGDEKWLKESIATADRYIATNIYCNTETPIRYMSFYNATVYAPWWNLIDLYEETGEQKYLDAAMYGAANTIAGTRSFPAVKDSLQTIHPGGHYEGNTTMWWKGKEKFRLGYPRTDGDSPEKKVEEWVVSPVGLGFEQPGTYFLRTPGKQVRPVFMSSWAPHLLRLYHYTGKQIYLTYARNAVIGRYSNYPGYYATGFTDITMSPEFPYKGPDVSSIYYHHIPPHFAFTWDFLMTEMIDRSEGNIYFPYSLQEGFVWFANRIYGGGKGRIFKDGNVSIWMRRGLVDMDNPTVNYVTAKSDRNFWILLSSESEKEEKVRIHIDRNLTGISGDRAKVFDKEGKDSETGISADSTLTIILPSKGFAAISLQREDKKPHYDLEPLEDGMRVTDSGTEFGKLFVFRIRSPFGWDSIYGFAETGPAEGMSMEAECNGRICKVSGYPFEWSFLKINPEEKAVIKLTLKTDGHPDIIKEIKL